MVGNLYEIGVFNDTAKFGVAARTVLANALGWDIDDPNNINFYPPQSDVGLQVWAVSNNSTANFHVRNSKVTSPATVLDYTNDSRYRHYWNILQSPEGVVAIRMVSFVTHIGQWSTMPNFEKVLVPSSDGLVGLSRESNNTFSIYYPNHDKMMYRATPNLLNNLALAGLPDTLHDTNFKGLYQGLCKPIDSFNGAYELNGKHYHTVMDSVFTLSMSID